MSAAGGPYRARSAAPRVSAPQRAWLWSAIACAALLLLPAIALLIVPRPTPPVLAPRPAATPANEAPVAPPPPEPAPRPVRPASTPTSPAVASPVSGVVLDPDGHCVAGAILTCNDHDPAISTTTDEEGRFSLAPEAVGCLAVATHPSFIASERTALVPGGRNSLRLNRGGGLEGEVVDERGAPIATYLLGIESYQSASANAAPSPAGQVRSIQDPAGAFTWENLAPGRYVLTAGAEARPPTRSRAVDDEANRTTHHVRIVLPRGASVSGRVLDADTKKPIAGAHLALDRVTTTRADAIRPVDSDDQGRYTLDGAPGGGPFSLRIWREGYRTRVLTGLTTRGAPALAQDIELNPITDGGPGGEDFAGIGAYLQAAPSGVSFSGLFPGGPAEQAGVRAGDLIKRIDGADASSLTVADCMQSLRGMPGTRVSVQVERGGQRLEISIERRALRL